MAAYSNSLGRNLSAGMVKGNLCGEDANCWHAVFHWDAPHAICKRGFNLKPNRLCVRGIQQSTKGGGGGGGGGGEGGGGEKKYCSYVIFVNVLTIYKWQSQRFLIHFTFECVRIRRIRIFYKLMYARQPGVCVQMVPVILGPYHSAYYLKPTAWDVPFRCALKFIIRCHVTIALSRSSAWWSENVSSP